MDRLLKKIEKKFPDIKWELAEPNSDVTNDFGDGIILAGTKAGETKSFFILSKDKNKERWAAVIAHHLHQLTKEQ